ncbi:MAG: NTP transferase domain-containing protein [Polyangiaceae bacterium]|nr:NTP transferase domain-containing protein [Polyangiaceae bacterium]
MILAAGLGTRLRPLTEELPKPLVPLGDRPLLGHIAAQLVAAGHRSALLNTHWLPDAFAPYLDRFGIELSVVHEPTIRGTAGGIAGARDQLGAPPIVIYNGDVVVEPPLERLAEVADDGLTLVVVPKEVGAGTVGLGADGGVVRIRGQSFGREVGGGDYVGVAAIGARCLARLPAVGCLVGDVALPALRRGECVGSVLHAGDFTDAGTVSAYLAANLAWLARLGRSVWVDPNATVASGVALSSSIVGEGARVEGTGRVERCVVWPGATARAPLADAIVTPRRVVDARAHR